MPISNNFESFEYSTACATSLQSINFWHFTTKQEVAAKVSENAATFLEVELARKSIVVVDFIGLLLACYCFEFVS